VSCVDAHTLHHPRPRVCDASTHHLAWRCQAWGDER
jgi:hypothetical protein